jgi:hypothetical protein
VALHHFRGGDFAGDEGVDIGLADQLTFVQMLFLEPALSFQICAQVRPASRVELEIDELLPNTDVAGMQLLTIADLLDRTRCTEHPDYEPDLNFKKAKQESDAQQQTLI